MPDKFEAGKKYVLIRDYIDETPGIGGIIPKGTVLRFEGPNFDYCRFTFLSLDKKPKTYKGVGVSVEHKTAFEIFMLPEESMEEQIQIQGKQLRSRIARWCGQKMSERYGLGIELLDANYLAWQHRVAKRTGNKKDTYKDCIKKATLEELLKLDVLILEDKLRM
ncbi:MAG: hypothetical protein WC976_06135 [Caldisericia bacterium]